LDTAPRHSSLQSHCRMSVEREGVERPALEPSVSRDAFMPARSNGLLCCSSARSESFVMRTPFKVVEHPTGWRLGVRDAISKTYSNLLTGHRNVRQQKIFCFSGQIL
jgi:hypothetical protein